VTAMFASVPVLTAFACCGFCSWQLWSVLQQSVSRKNVRAGVLKPWN